MTLSEKAVYLKGIRDALNLDPEKGETKLLSGIVDLLVDVTKRLSDVEETTIAISDELDAIEEDLDAIEDYILDEDEDFEEDFDEDEDEDEDFFDFDDDEDEEEPEEGFDFGDEDSTIYEVECICGEIIDFDEETLEKGSILCPNCGEKLEFSLEDEDEEEEMPF